MDVGKGLERYLRHHRAEGSSDKTLTWHRLSISQFATYLQAQQHSLDVDDLAADDLRGWIDDLRQRQLAQASVASKVRSVKAFGKWLAAEDYVPRDPFARVKQTKVDDQPKDTLAPAEVERLLASCDRKTATGARDFALMLLLYSTGLRASEALALTVDDVDADKGLITVRRGKGGRFRVVPLGRAVEKALFKYLDQPARKRYGDSGYIFLTGTGEPMGLNTLQLALQRHSRATGIHANAHKFRHSAAITYLRNGGRVETLRAMLGHSTLDMTLHYARIAGVDLTAAHEVADPAKALRTRV